MCVSAKFKSKKAGKRIKATKGPKEERRMNLGSIHCLYYAFNCNLTLIQLVNYLVNMQCYV